MKVPSGCNVAVSVPEREARDLKRQSEFGLGLEEMEGKWKGNPSSGVNVQVVI